MAGSLLLFGTGPLGWTIGIAAAVIVAIAGISIGQKEKARKEYEASELAARVKEYMGIAEKRDRNCFQCYAEYTDSGSKHNGC